MIEKLGRGSSIIMDDGYTLKMVIPTRKTVGLFFAIVFLCAWLGGWAIGEVVVISTLLKIGPFATNPGGNIPVGVDFFMVFWLIAWTLGGLFMIMVILRWLFGEEWIELAQGILTLTKGFLFYRPYKRYSIDQITNLRLRPSGPNSFFTSNSIESWIQGTGTLCFDYGMKTVKFATSIDEAEAKYLLTLLEKKGLHTGQVIRPESTRLT